MTADHDAPDTVTDGDEPTSTATEAAAIETQDAAEPKTGVAERQPKALSHWLALVLQAWIALALAGVLLAAAGLAAWMFFFVYQPDRQMDDAAAQSAIKSASDGTVSLLSYSPESLDADFASAKSKLTGSFLSYYTQFTEQIVAPAAKQKAVKTKASVVRAALSEIHPDSAVVLVFINQTTESKDRPDASFINSAVRVTLQKVDGGWLISSFDPV